MMLSENDRQFRTLVTQLDGIQGDVAAALGVTVTAVIKRLNGRKHLQWWSAFKASRSRKRRRARAKRAYKVLQAKIAREDEERRERARNPALARALDLLGPL